MPCVQCQLQIQTWLWYQFSCISSSVLALEVTLRDRVLQKATQSRVGQSDGSHGILVHEVAGQQRACPERKRRKCVDEVECLLRR